MRVNWLVCWLFILAAASTAPAGADQQADLEALRSRIKEITAQLNQDRVRQSDVRDQLNRVEKKIADLNRALHATQTQIAAGNRRIEATQADIGELGRELADKHAQLQNLIYATYIGGRAEYFKLLLNQEDPNRLGRATVYYRYLSRARVVDIHQMEELIGRLNLLKAELEEERMELTALQAAQLSRREDLELARVERNALLEEIGRRIESNQDALAEAKRNAARLERLLRDLREALPSLPAGFDRRFGKMRGKLSLPVRGAISARFGQPRGISGMPWQGLLMDAQEGSTVYSIFPGRVAFADWLRGFGLLLILDHGDGYMSLYSHNQVLYKQVGEWVDDVEPIAAVGSSGGLKQAGLYFEIRQNGEPRNPLIWCKVN